VLAGGGRKFRARRAAVGDGEEHWRTRISVLRRGNLTGVDLTAVESYGDAVEGLSHAAHGREAAVDGEHIHIRRGNDGTVAGVIYRLKFIPGGDLQALHGPHES